MYFLLNAKASNVLQNEVQNGGGTKRWGTKYFKHSSNLRNTMVVPYLDKDHWSLYIHEEKRCIHAILFQGSTMMQHLGNLHVMYVLHGPY